MTLSGCTRWIGSAWLLLPALLSAGPQTVGVVLFNDSSAPFSVIESAEAGSRQALQAAGVRLSWINAKADLNWQGPDLVLRAAILRRAPLSRRIDAFGTALPANNAGVQIFIYYDRLVALSRAASLPLEVVLSGALTHEIGHMLLRSSAHSLAGVMKGEWQFRDLEELGQGRLCFTRQQNRQMLENLKGAGREGLSEILPCAPTHRSGDRTAKRPSPDRLSN